MTQKTNGTVTGRMTIQNVKQSKVDETLAILGKNKNIQVRNLNFLAGKSHLNTAMFDITYGPVAGGWQSDVIRHVRNALAKAGSTATATMTNYRREATPR